MSELGMFIMLRFPEEPKFESIPKTTKAEPKKKKISDESRHLYNEMIVLLMLVVSI